MTILLQSIDRSIALPSDEIIISLTVSNISYRPHAFYSTSRPEKDGYCEKEKKGGTSATLC